jgi:hypothetical protein
MAHSGARRNVPVGSFFILDARPRRNVPNRAISRHSSEGSGGSEYLTTGVSARFGFVLQIRDSGCIP